MIALLTPIKRPALSSSGPPELPGLIAASVWITPLTSCMVAVGKRRPNALTIPEVKVCSRPYGFPIAKAACRTRRSAEWPIAMGRKGDLGRSSCKTAKS